MLGADGELAWQLHRRHEDGWGTQRDRGRRVLLYRGLVRGGDEIQEFALADFIRGLRSSGTVGMVLPEV